MSVLAKFAAVAVIGSASLALALSEGPSALDNERCELDIARDWVRSELTVLPTSLAEVRQYDRNRQRAIYSASSAELRASFWRERLVELMIDPQAVDSPQQRSRLAELAESMPEVLAYQKPQMDSLMRTLIAEFGKERASWMFSSFDKEMTPSSRLAAASGSCSCNVGGIEWCDLTPPTGPSSHCKAGANGCQATEDGCGGFWNWPCNGQCQPGNACDTCTTLPGGEL